MINEHFGFSENPFNATPDPRYLFLTESHQEALASVVYGVREKKGFVCVSGEIGTGKTTLIRHLLNTLDPDIKTVFIYQTLISFEELLKIAFKDRFIRALDHPILRRLRGEA